MDGFQKHGEFDLLTHDFSCFHINPVQLNYLFGGIYTYNGSGSDIHDGSCDWPAKSSFSSNLGILMPSAREDLTSNKIILKSHHLPITSGGKRPFHFLCLSHIPGFEFKDSGRRS
jgi:hypothetical protein